MYAMRIFTIPDLLYCGRLSNDAVQPVRIALVVNDPIGNI